MAKKLADMTPAERAECIGMWATNHNYTGDGEDIGVIACVQHDCVWLIHTCLHGEWSMFSINNVSPRPDLPRAWNPDGTPPTTEITETTTLGKLTIQTTTTHPNPHNTITLRITE